MKFYTMWFTALLMSVFFMTGCGLTDPVLPDAAVAVAPTVTLTMPADIADPVAINTNIRATFSVPMDPLTLTDTTFTLKNNLSVPVAGTVSYLGNTATFNPDSDLAVSTTYTATITTGAKNLAGTALAVNKVWSFTTGAASDTTPPIVSSTLPADSAGSVLLSANITATFSETMDISTITSTTFTLKQGLTPIAGVVTYAGLTATFNPDSDLTAGTIYSATITVAAMDLAGNPLAAEKIWTFTTGGALEANPGIVNLLTAGNFTIFSKTSITTTPGVIETSITGDIGIAAAAVGIQGFGLIGPEAPNAYSTSALVTGHIYAVNYPVPSPTTVDNASNDSLAAYNAAVGRPVSSGATTNVGTGGEIGGLILTRGVYKWNQQVTIATDVTLNGGQDDVFIMVTSSGFSMTGGAKIILTGGAQAKNVFWVSATTFQTAGPEIIKGVLISMTNITLGNGTVVNGRLLGQTEVTLIGNTITPPTP